ncbi:MAG: ThiF family adenylyltransferase [Bdellovibrionales bacterium]|nr:ThiF family adenylyltransferase [Bdellovibrionales bacterium]
MTNLYEHLVLRNQGYISKALQERISNTKVLVVGCGIGSQVAEAAARIGFQNFVLVDGDTIDSHNLNRQSFFFDQIGKYKVDALKENILRINPEAKVDAHPTLVSTENVKSFMESIDLVFDTVDFLDLSGIIAVHDEAHLQKKYLVSSFAVGFGAAVISLPPTNRDHAWARDIFNLPAKGNVDSSSYVTHFIDLFSKLATELDPKVVEVMQGVFAQLADGKACPAPQVSPGAYTVASACLTAAVKMLDNENLTLGPEMVVVNLVKQLTSPGIKLVA